MPATAGRVRMPANNRVHSSAALQTHGIWQSAIGYDPYAPDQKDKQAGGASANHAAIGVSEQNAYDSFQGLLALARLTSSTANEARGSCKKCGRVGHLTFQCRNFLTITKEDVAAAAAAVERDRVGAKGKDVGEVSESDEDSSDEDSEISDSDEDSEMERALAVRFGKTIRKSKSGGDAGRLSSKKISSHSRKSRKDRDISFDEADDIDLDASRETSERKKGKTKKQIKTKKRRDLSSDEAEEEDESSGYEERRSRKHHHCHKKNRSSSKKKRSSSGFETDNSEDDRRRHMHKRDKNGDHRKEHGKHKKSKHRKRHSSTAELGFGEKEAERPHKYRNDGEMRYSEEESDEYRHKKARNDSGKHSGKHSHFSSNGS